MVYGLEILCEISKVPFEISHKILNPSTAKYAFYRHLFLRVIYDIFDLWFVISLSETVPRLPVIWWWCNSLHWLCLHCILYFSDDDDPICDDPELLMPQRSKTMMPHAPTTNKSLTRKLSNFGVSNVNLERMKNAKNAAERAIKVRIVSILRHEIVFFRQYFETFFSTTFLYSYSNSCFTEVCSWRSNWLQVGIGTGNSLLSSRQQAITLTIVDKDLCHNDRVI